MRNRNRENISVITMSAFALALSIVSLSMFRGPISIVSSFLIPPIIVLFSKDSPWKRYFFLITSGLLILTFLFFRTHIVFIPFYILLALYLKFVIAEVHQKKSKKVVKLIIYVLLVLISIFLGIYFTEKIFLVPLHSLIIRLSGNNPINYIGILLFEAIITASVNIGFVRVFYSRIHIYKSLR